MIESYVLRRAICGYQTRGYWQIFASLGYNIGDERPLRAGRDVDRVAPARREPRGERVERPRVEMQPVAGRMPALDGGELRPTGGLALDARQDDDRADDHRRGERRRDDQPKRRTPNRTRIALKPSLHVIFFPSA